jgi:hypothetical protein
MVLKHEFAVDKFQAEAKPTPNEFGFGQTV